MPRLVVTDTGRSSRGPVSPATHLSSRGYFADERSFAHDSREAKHDQDHFVMRENLFQMLEQQVCPLAVRVQNACSNMGEIYRTCSCIFSARIGAKIPNWVDYLGALVYAIKPSTLLANYQSMFCEEKTRFLLHAKKNSISVLYVSER